MTNADRAQWSRAGLHGDEAAVVKHFVAVSTNAAAVAASARPRPCSASGLGRRALLDGVRHRPSMMLAIGPDHFR
jgi:hypothetical protein